jgi:outer membrane protein TolC
MRTIQLLGSMLLVLSRLQGQTDTALSIHQCYQLAKQNYPLVKQMALIEKTREYTIANASKGYLPQFNIAGQATYQSEVTKIPISLPNVTLNELSKDQYRIYGELSQSLTDPFIIKQQKELLKAGSATDVEKLEVELYKLKERINQVYFGILLIDAQLQQTDLLKKDIRTGLQKITAAIANGIALKSNADLLNAELLKAEQRSIELKANRKGFTDMLSVFVNKPISETASLKEPSIQSLSSTINRPELKLFGIQEKSFDLQNKLLLAKNLPRLSLFFQGGYGRPTLNMLSNEFGTYYIGGARFSWNVSGCYTYKKEKKLQGLQQQSIDLQKEVFLFNTTLALKQQNNEISKLSELIGSDQQIITLRRNIKTTSYEQLANGTITTLDYLNYVNAEDQASQQLLLHRIQLLMAQYTYQTTSGN